MSTTSEAARYRSRDGLSLFYRDFPPRGQATGVPALCLPGLTRNSRDFLDLARHLQHSRRVTCPDLRGRGHSDRDPEWRHYQPPTYVEDAWLLLDRLGLERVTVIGTSLGGLMGMMMAAAQPQRIAGLVLNDIGPEIAPEGMAHIRSYVGQVTTAADWDEARELTRATYADALPDLTAARWLEYTRRGWRENAQGRPTPDYDPDIARLIREAGDADAPDLWPVFGQLRCPLLVVHGARSNILSAQTIERMQDKHPALEAVTIANRGHVPLLDETGSLDAIDRFLARVDANA